MPYIAFFDMLGTRAAATINRHEYTEAVNNFNNALKQLAPAYRCKVYGYSDNAYAEIENLPDMIGFFRFLRDSLMKKHRYLTIAVDCGTLNAEKICLDPDRGFSMKFTDPSTTGIYITQTQFSGIGVSLSENVIRDLRNEGLEDCFRSSIYQKSHYVDNSSSYITVYDLSYSSVSLEMLNYIMADHLITAASNTRAGRYYLTPIITMIKGLDKNTISDRINDLITLLNFKNIPNAFQNIANHNEYSTFFLFALIDSILSLREKNKSFDATKLCKQIIEQSHLNNPETTNKLQQIPAAVITPANKNLYLRILYHVGQGDHQ